MDGWNEEVVLGIAAGGILLFLIVTIWLIVITRKLGKLKADYNKIMGGTGVDNFDEVIYSIHDRIDVLTKGHRNLNHTIEQHDRRLSSLKGRIGVHRFNAFSDSGSDLSFSIAFLNEEQDGVAITGIYGREQTFLYAKPIDKGQSAYMLTPEEKIAINLALQKG